MESVLIITGYYNREGHVDDCVKSLLAQTYRNSHVIAFDDCSTDNSYERLRKFNSDRFTALKFDYNMGFVNGLIYVIQNFGADYDFFYIHGSGDIADRVLIEKEVRFLQHNKDAVAVSSLFKNFDIKTQQFKRVNINSKLTREHFLKRNQISQGGTMIRRSAYNLAGGYSRLFKYCQDYDLWLRLTQFGFIGVLQDCFYTRKELADGASVKTEKFIEQGKYYLLAQSEVSIINDSISDFNIHAYIKDSSWLFQQKLFKHNLLKSINGDDFNFDLLYFHSYGLFKPLNFVIFKIITHRKTNSFFQTLLVKYRKSKNNRTDV